MGTAILDANGRPYAADHDEAMNAEQLGLVGGPGEPGLARAKFFGSGFGGGGGDYLRALALTRAPASFRAREPLSSHAWVFASAWAIGIAMMQAPFKVWQETSSEQKRRQIRAKDMGEPWNGFAPRGAGRRAFLRHMKRPVAYRMTSFLKAAEPVLNHPLMDVLTRPNPLQDQQQLFMCTALWLAVRGECFWVMTDDDGGPIAPGDVPARIYPIGPDPFSPVLERITTGDLVGWDVTLPRWMPGDRSTSTVTLESHEVVHFKFSNPADILRGMAPLTSAAGAIERDLMIGVHNRSLLANEAVPHGVVYSDIMMSKEKEDELRTKWNERHKGEDNAGRTTFLTGGLKYLPIAFSPKDMQYIEQSKMDREEVLAVMGVPPSILGLTEFTNYATAMSQARRFWDNRVLPLIHCIEGALDASTMLFKEPDSTFVMADLSNVEELRVGITEKVAQAKELAGDALHVPPRDAFETVGLDMPRYKGDDVALVGGLAMPVEVALEAEPPSDPPSEPAAPGEEDPAAPPAEDDPPAEEDEDDLEKAGVHPETALAAAWERRRRKSRPTAAEVNTSVVLGVGPAAEVLQDMRDGFVPPPAAAALVWVEGAPIEWAQALAGSSAGYQAQGGRPRDWARLRAYARALAPHGPLLRVRGGKAAKARADRRWREFVVVQEQLGGKFRNAYRGWVRSQGDGILQRFDAATGGRAMRALRFDALKQHVDLTAILPKFEDASADLKSRSRPVYQGGLEDTYEFTMDDVGGIPVVPIDSEDIAEFMDRREQKFAGTTTETLIKSVRTTLEKGISQGETIQQLRVRIGEKLGIAEGSYKTLQVARTESAGFMNGVRNEIFTETGFEKQFWLPAGDEATRPDHLKFGESKSRPFGFNWLEIVDRSDGTLRYAGDSDGPADEVINCRCAMVPDSGE